MKKFVPAMMIALMALAMATTVSADNGKNRGRGEGLWRNAFNKQRQFDRKSLKGWMHGHMFGLEKVFGDCGSDARADLNDATKTAFSTFVKAKDAAREDRDDAIEAADGDQAKIIAAWKDYRDAYLDALKTYQEAAMAAMTTFRTDFAKCDVVLNSPKPTPTATTLPSFSLDVVKTHNTDSDCWIAIDGKVYNVTSYIADHDSSTAELKALCGTDGSDEYSGIASNKKPNSLKSYRIGTLQ